MTLITHFRNSQIAVVAGDSMNTCTNARFTDFKARKVFEFADCIIGFYGDINGFMNWVELDLSTDEQRRKNGYEQIIKKAYDIKDDDRFFGIVTASFEKSVLVSHPNKNEIVEIELNMDGNSEHKMHHCTSKNVFFSPQFKDGQIDYEHSDLLFQLFTGTYMEIYNQEFNLESIIDDEKLNMLLYMFNRKIKMDDNLHRGRIGGEVKYHVIEFENHKISELKTGKGLC